MTITIGMRDLRNNTSKVIEAVTAGEVVVLTNHGTPIATIVPAVPPKSAWARAALITGDESQALLALQFDPRTLLVSQLGN
ncbi:MAG TPA: type II toxin-antitoxin system prevent-host-death family antitoxin [Ilumatobacteraceae bacterium]